MTFITLTRIMEDARNPMTKTWSKNVRDRVKIRVSSINTYGDHFCAGVGYGYEVVENGEEITNLIESVDI